MKKIVSILMLLLVTLTLGLMTSCDIQDVSSTTKSSNVTTQINVNNDTETVKSSDIKPTSEITLPIEETIIVYEIVSEEVVVEASETYIPSILTLSRRMRDRRIPMNVIVPSSYDIIVENDGHGTASANVTTAAPGDIVILVAEPNDGYMFKEWNVISGGVTINDNKFTMPENNVTVKAIFEEIPAPITKYNVTFDLNGITGTAPDAQTIASGGKVTTPTDPTAPDGSIVTFEGWYRTKNTTTGELSNPWNFDNDVVDSNTKLYAQWKTVISKIVMTNSSVPTVENFNWESPITVIIPENAWATSDGNKAFWVPGEDSGFAMIHTDDKQTEVFGLDDNDTFIKVGDKYVCTNYYGTSTCTMTNSVFTSLEFVGSSSFTDNFDGTYTAPSPTPETTYTVTFDIQGHGAQIDSFTNITSGSKISAPTAPTADGYTFDGWYKTKDATTGELSEEWDFDNNTVTADTILYAKWTPATIAALLATVEGGFPTSTDQNTVPDEAWHSGTNHFAYVYSTALFIKQPTDEDGSKAGFTPILLNNPVTKDGNSYTYSHTIFNLTFNMTNGKLTSIVISGSSGNTKYDGTYTAPSST